MEWGWVGQLSVHHETGTAQKGPGHRVCTELREGLVLVEGQEGPIRQPGRQDSQGHR